MGTKIEIKEEGALPYEIGLQNEREFFTKVVTMKTDSKALLMDGDCDLAIKAEIKSETPFPHFGPEIQSICATKHSTKHIKSETITSSNIFEINIKSETEEQTLTLDHGSLNDRKSLPDNPVIKDKKYNIDDGMDSKIEIDEESWWLEKEASSAFDDVKVEDFPLVKSSRFYTKAISGNSNGKGSIRSPLPCAELSERHRSLFKGKVHPEYESKANEIMEIPTLEEIPYSEQSDKPTNEEEIYSKKVLKQKSLMHKDRSPYKFNNCKVRLTKLSTLKMHNLFQEDKKPFQCKTCNNSFTQLSHLKRHSLIHEGKKPYQCKICDKSFTQLTNLKRHNLIHEDKKPFQCEICDKSFTLLSNLKRHILIHNGKKPYQCKTCYKSFIQLSNLKIHNLCHEGKKPHQCEKCGKSFTQMSHLKRHNLIHESKKPHQCKTCDKSFIQLSNLKSHSLSHEEKKPLQCKTCGQSFTQPSHLKTHNLIHEDMKPHMCKTCKKRFTRLSNLKMHNFIHEGKRPHKCTICDKSFTRLEHLKKHHLVHEKGKPQ